MYCLGGSQLEIQISLHTPKLPQALDKTMSCGLVAKLCHFVTPWTAAHQSHLSMGFPRQECWSGLPFPSPGDLPDPGLEPASSGLAGRFFLLSHQGSPLVTVTLYYNGDQSAKTGVTDPGAFLFYLPFFSTLGVSLTLTLGTSFFSG